MQTVCIPALREVLVALGIEVEVVVFGHVHRRGPLPSDSPARWTGRSGQPRLLNTGSWVYEPLLVQGARPPHPYWPGGAVLLEPDGQARSVGLLDGVSERELLSER